MIDPTINQVLMMMDFLQKDSFIVPYYDLPLPPEADDKNYRPNKIFTLLNDGTLSYKGFGVKNFSGKNVLKKDIIITGIKPTQRWIDRSYLFLADDVRAKVRLQTQKATMRDVAKLVLRFNGLSFLDI
jgi:hypothetical protein